MKQDEKHKIKWKEIKWKQIGMDKLLLLLLAGVLLVVIAIPTGNSEEKTKESEITASVKEEEVTEDEKKEMEEKLKSVLGKVEGVGQVEVMITLKSSKELVVEKDRPETSNTVTEQDSEGGSRSTSEITKEEATVYGTNSAGEETPFIIKEIEPEVEGVIVIAEGGNNTKVVSQITEAVEALFRVPSHKVKVLKMKENN
jgi:stage III sporulation protein AG